MSFYRPIIFFGRKLHYIFLILLGLPGIQTWHVNGTSVDEILIPPKISGGPSAEVSYIFTSLYRLVLWIQLPPIYS